MYYDGERLTSEVVALEETLATLDGAIAALESALRSVTATAELVAEAPLMPNYLRAEEQLRTALNASLGARRSVLRRVATRRSVLGAKHPPAEADETV